MGDYESSLSGKYCEYDTTGYIEFKYKGLHISSIHMVYYENHSKESIWIKFSNINNTEIQLPNSLDVSVLTEYN